MTLAEILKQRAHDGLPIYFLGELAGAAFEAHVATIGQLQRDLGRAITVVYGLADDDHRDACAGCGGDVDVGGAVE